MVRACGELQNQIPRTPYFIGSVRKRTVAAGMFILYIAVWLCMDF